MQVDPFNGPLTLWALAAAVSIPIGFGGYTPVKRRFTLRWLLLLISLEAVAFAVLAYAGPNFFQEGFWR